MEGLCKDGRLKREAKFRVRFLFLFFFSFSFFFRALYEFLDELRDEEIKIKSLCRASMKDRIDD